MLEKRQLEEAGQRKMPFYDPELEIRKRLSLFRENIKGFNIKGLDASKLTEEDMVLFERFETGQLTIWDIVKQENILYDVREKAEASLKLLVFMREELEKEH